MHQHLKTNVFFEHFQQQQQEGLPSFVHIFLIAINNIIACNYLQSFFTCLLLQHGTKKQHLSLHLFQHVIVIIS